METHFVVHVCYVLYKFDIEAEIVPHDPPQHVCSDIVPRVSEMARIVDGRSAAVPGYFLPAGVDGDEGLLLPGEGVVDSQRGERDAGGRWGTGPWGLFATGGGGHSEGNAGGGEEAQLEGAGQEGGEAGEGGERGGVEGHEERGRGSK